jgi:integrase
MQPSRKGREVNSREFLEYLKQKKFKRPSQSFGLIGSDYFNGVDKKITLGEVFEKYKSLHLSTLSDSSRSVKTRRCQNFIRPLSEIKMIDMNPQLLSEFIIFMKENHQVLSSKKYNYDKQIKDLKSIFNWYIDTVDFRFSNPVKKHHLKLGIIEEIPEKERQISEEEVKLFFAALPSFYRDLAMIQFFCAGRIGEVAGIHRKNIDLEKRILTIKDILVWIKSVPTHKSCPKNGAARFVHINDTMLEIFKRKINEQPSGTNYLFNRKGRPLRYNAINENYNKAWGRAGLDHKFSGTHQIRYAAAQIARRKTGSLDMAKAITGHKSSRMAEKYSHYVDTDMNRSAQVGLEDLFLAA